MPSTRIDEHPISEEALFQFSRGTSRYWRHFIPGVAYTDGVRYLMENGAGWLIDAIASYLPSLQRSITKRLAELDDKAAQDEPYEAEFMSDMATRHHWYFFKGEGRSATLEARPYRGEALIKQDFIYAEFPLDEFEILCGCWDGSQGIRWIISLPVED